MQVMNADIVVLDGAEHFQKMTGRNRYDITGSNNPVRLSVPLAAGRSQHTPMSDVLIYNKERWQIQHWRTLVSVYKRTPYFEHYEPGLQQLFQTEYTHLAVFNRATIEWVMRQLKLNFELQETNDYIKQYPETVKDLRNVRSGSPVPRYYQVFEDRVGFIPDLSILDLLFSEGPSATKMLV